MQITKDTNPRMRYFYNNSNRGVVSVYSEKNIMENGDVSIDYSSSFCSPTDNFDKTIARNLCAHRPMRNIYIPKNVFQRATSKNNFTAWDFINIMIVRDLLTLDIPRHAVDTLVDNI